jgi:hypothetical protein
MYATVEIEARLAEDAVIVPREAVIDTGERQVAFVVEDAGRFEPRRVRGGVENDAGQLQVLEGLEPGELVVTSGQFLLDVESRTQEAIQKLLSEKLLQKPVEAPGSASSALAPVDAAAREMLRPAVDALLAPYLGVASALADDEAAKAQAWTPALAQSARLLAETAAGGPLEAHARSLHEAARGLGGQPIEEMRQRFRSLSHAVIALLGRVPPSRAAGANLHVVRCPMYPGEWVQAGKEVANPFYGSAMRACGETPRPVPVEESR